MSNNIYMKPNLIIEPIHLDQIIKYDKERFNSNNHWIGNTRPEDYRDKLDASHTSKWIDSFHSPESYIKFVIDNPYHINWFKRANSISSQTGKFSKLFEDELEEFVKYFEQTYPRVVTQVLSLSNQIPWFVRTENVSLKYGQNGIGPYYNIKQIIESLVSSVGGHSPIYPDTKQITFYLLPFNYLISDSNEFRVFVCDGRITAISQQSCYSKFKPDSNLNLEPDYDLKKLFETYADIICSYFESNIKSVLPINSFTYDFSIGYDSTCNQFKPYFIEFNCFGKEYAAGSSLFHWLIDEDKLYGFNTSKPEIYFRYVC